MQAIAEDLGALVKENQMIGHRLVAITAERDRWQVDMGAAAERAQRAETVAHCRDSDASQLRREHEVSWQTPHRCYPQAELRDPVEGCAWPFHPVRAPREHVVQELWQAGQDACHLSSNKNNRLDAGGSQCMYEEVLWGAKLMRWPHLCTRC